MIDKVADLSHQLREVGLPVSVRSTQSAAQIYRELGEDDRNLLKTALRAIYVKDKYDIPKFNKIFENVFKKEPRKRKFLMLNREAKPTREQDLNLISILLKNKAIFPPKLRKKKLIMKN